MQKAGHLSGFIRLVQTTPEFVCVLGLRQAFQLANRLMSHSSLVSNHNQEICYDTTFNIGDFFISTLLMRNVEIAEEPYFPIAFFIHDRKRTEDHEFFFKTISTLLIVNDNIPFISDREQAIDAGLKAFPELYKNRLFCSNHLVKNAERHSAKNATQDDAKKFTSEVKKLAFCNSLDKYLELESKFSDGWTESLRSYFDRHLSEDLSMNFRKLDEKRFYIYFRGKKSIVNTGSEAFHSRFKKVFSAEKITRTEQVVISLFIDQHNKLREFNRAYQSTGKYTTKPEFDHLRNQLIELPTVKMDVEELMISAKQAVIACEPEVVENNFDNFAEKRLAEEVIQSGGIFFVKEFNTFLVKNPFKEDHNTVKILSSGKFSCDCKINKKIDCLHLIAAKMHLNQNEEIKAYQPHQKYSQLTRTYTREPKGGKKQPRQRDLDKFPVSDSIISLPAPSLNFLSQNDDFSLLGSPAQSPEQSEAEEAEIDDSEPESDESEFEYSHLMTEAGLIARQKMLTEYEEKMKSFDSLKKATSMLRANLENIEEHTPWAILDRMGTLLGQDRVILDDLDWNAVLRSKPVPNNSIAELLVKASRFFLDDVHLNPEHHWISGGRRPYYLTDEDLKHIKSKDEWISGDAVTWALFDLQSQFPAITGFLPLRHIEKPNEIRLAQNDYGIFAQIINTGVHFVTICGYFTPTEISLNVYDSENYAFRSDGIQMEEKMFDILCGCFRQHQATKFNFTFCEVDQQTPGNCGINAIANLTAFLHAIDPTSITYSNKREYSMRKHFETCFTNGRLDPFNYEPCIARKTIKGSAPKPRKP